MTQSEVTPPLVDTGDRVPVTAAAKRGVVDPASALAMPARTKGALLDPENCNRTLPVFDGATRFDVVLSYGETREIPEARLQRAGAGLQRPLRRHRRPPARPARCEVHGREPRHVGLARPRRGGAGAGADADRRAHDAGTNIIEATRWTQTGTSTAQGGDVTPATVAEASLSGR